MPELELRWAVTNLEYGGRKNGHNEPLYQTLDVVKNLDPHVWCVQEMGHENPGKLMEHLLLIARETGMRPFLGPVCGLGGPAHGNRVAIFVSREYEATDMWPGPGQKQDLPWMRVQISGPGLDRPAHVHSAHFSARSQDDREHAAQVIGSWSADQAAQGGIMMLGGDLNCQAPDGAGHCPVDRWPPRLVPQRAVPVPEGTPGAARVGDQWWLPHVEPGLILQRHGFRDVAHLVATRTRDDAPYESTGCTGDARVDQMLVIGLEHCEMTYETHPVGSDHKTLSAAIRLPG